MPALTLYTDAFWISPYTFTAFVALNEKGLSFAIEEIALQRGEQRNEAFAKLSSTMRVPTLVHDEFSLAESSAIVDYLEEAFAAPAYPRLLPSSIKERAHARQVLAWIRSDLLALRAEFPTSSMFYPGKRDPLSDAGVVAARRLVDIADRLIPNGATQFFSEWSVADADLAFMLHRLILNDYEIPEKQLAFAKAQWARPSVRAFVDHVRPPYEAY